MAGFAFVHDVGNRNQTINIVTAHIKLHFAPYVRAFFPFSEDGVACRDGVVCGILIVSYAFGRRIAFTLVEVRKLQIFDCRKVEEIDVAFMLGILVASFFIQDVLSVAVVEIVLTVFVRIVIDVVLTVFFILHGVVEKVFVAVNRREVDVLHIIDVNVELHFKVPRVRLVVFGKQGGKIVIVATVTALVYTLVSALSALITADILSFITTRHKRADAKHDDQKRQKVLFDVFHIFLSVGVVFCHYTTKQCLLQRKNNSSPLLSIFHICPKRFCALAKTADFHRGAQRQTLSNGRLPKNNTLRKERVFLFYVSLSADCSEREARAAYATFVCEGISVASNTTTRYGHRISAYRSRHRFAHC